MCKNLWKERTSQDDGVERPRAHLLSTGTTKPQLPAGKPSKQKTETYEKRSSTTRHKEGTTMRWVRRVDSQYNQVPCPQVGYPQNGE